MGSVSLDIADVTVLQRYYLRLILDRCATAYHSCRLNYTTFQNIKTMADKITFVDLETLAS